MSASTLTHRIAAIALLYTYYRARARPVLDVPGTADLYQDLAEAIVLGTTSHDRHVPGLLWQPCGSRNATRHLRGIRAYSDFLVSEYAGAALYPTVTGDALQLAVAFRFHLEQKKAHSLFSHLIDVRRSMAGARASEGDPVGLRRSGLGASRKSTPIPFPEKHVVEFFAVGLRRRKVSDRCGDPVADNYNVRDLLYFLLLMFGGLRAAEPLHLYVDDVQPDIELGQGTSVFLWHPADGPSPTLSPSGKHTGILNRRQYLEKQFGRVPRNEMTTNPQAAGWKNLLLEETVPRVGHRTRVYWQNPAVGHLFWKLHGVYMRHVRPSVVSHPYYFVSIDRESFANPWTEASAQDAFRSALRRMGLQPSSAAGLCRHAMRHRLGHRLAQCGLLPQQIQIILHHQSPASQAIYSRQQRADVAKSLAAAELKREHGVADFNANDLGIPWKSDPLHLYEGPSKILRERLLCDTVTYR